MIWILCILIGLCLGQHIKITVSPELLAFLRSTWAQLDKLIGEALPALAEWRDRAMLRELRAGTLHSADIAKAEETQEQRHE